MAKIPESDNLIVNAINEMHERNQRHLPRPHMGVSQLGLRCDRRLWFTFRWAHSDEHEGRMLRLFRRGHNEEPTIVDDLRNIGVMVTNVEDNQINLQFGSHVSGSMDGIAKKGVPGNTNQAHILEFKTASKKAFDRLAKYGVAKEKWQHYVQMQCYMMGTGISKALYITVCKDNDTMYTETIDYDEDIANYYIERGKRIALSNRIPEPISNNPSWYECKFCPAWDLCHGSQTTTEVNCRTCAHSTPQEDGTWRCEYWGAEIPEEWQEVGCQSHTLHPDLVPWPMDDGLDDWTAVYIINGNRVANGKRREGVYSSKEILANPNACASDDPYLKDLQTVLQGRIVG